MAVVVSHVGADFAALVDWTHRDLRGRSGLVFSVRADGVYRMWVQVRDENNAAEDGTEWWFQSVRTSRYFCSAQVAVSGDCDAGLSTTLFPVASAAPSFQAVMISG